MSVNERDGRHGRLSAMRKPPGDRGIQFMRRDVFHPPHACIHSTRVLNRKKEVGPEKTLLGQTRDRRERFLFDPRDFVFHGKDPEDVAFRGDADLVFELTEKPFGTNSQNEVQYLVEKDQNSDDCTG